jgi:hypothetical protein
MFHAFHVMIDHTIVYTEQFKELTELLVPLSDSASQFFSRSG